MFATPAAPGPDQERARLRLKTGTFDAAPPASGRAPERAAGARVGSFDAVRGEPGVEPARARLEPAGAVFAAAAAGPAGAGAGPGPARRTEPGAGFPGAEAAAAIPSAPRPSPAPALDQGVTILEKPRPDYTPEARAARIEGEVLLEVVFTAGGEVRVRRVRRGLGHGLDENAVAAARRIRFRPATAGGRAVDFEATIRVAFQLAY